MFKVIWDNGHACDAFPHRFDTEEEAREFAEAWLAEAVATDPDPDAAAEAYSYEVVEA